MKTARRKFLKVAGAAAGLTAATGAGWLGFSDSRLARMGRQITRDTRRTPLAPSATPRPETWSDQHITFAWLGHATVLINFYGVHILTDPAFSARVGIDALIATLGPKRLVAPALRFDQLPPIDLVLLSHAHMDHMDVPTLARFGAGQTVITAKDTSDFLKPTQLRQVTELNWNESHTLQTERGELHIEAFEVKHWGRRWPNDRARGYNGYILRREDRALLFGGDTAMTPLFGNLRPRGPFAAALMPVGAYDPWIHAHCTPEEAVRMADAAGADRIAPIHHATFTLSDEPATEPLERFEQALAAERGRLALRHIGETALLT
jgi:L-ascorbate metabolism protein UlaG (beta-lactamase superfamily)